MREKPPSDLDEAVKDRTGAKFVAEARASTEKRHETDYASYVADCERRGDVPVCYMNWHCRVKAEEKKARE